eukprot:UN13546
MGCCNCFNNGEQQNVEIMANQVNGKTSPNVRTPLSANIKMAQDFSSIVLDGTITPYDDYMLEIHCLEPQKSRNASFPTLKNVKSVSENKETNTTKHGVKKEWKLDITFDSTNNEIASFLRHDKTNKMWIKKVNDTELNIKDDINDMKK